jgi:eukaryotic-like serine/threonine-protein kinase
MTRHLLFTLCVVISLAAACSGQTEAQGEQTRAALANAGATADSVKTQQAQPSPTAPATATLVPTATPAPTQTPAPTSTPKPTSTPTPITRPVQKDPLVLALAEGVEIPLVSVPAGEFLMGSGPEDKDAEKDEKPQHTVYLDEYLVGKTEVTVAQFRVFVQVTGYKADPRILTVKDDRPVSYVTWDDAVAFCKWLSEWTGRTVTLPTEAQWEKAARGTDGRIYPWGNQPVDCTLANYFKAGGYCAGPTEFDTSPVGSYPNGASPYGVMDMAGNVWEWVNDWYKSDYYAISPESNPVGPADGLYKVERGGAWQDPPYVRSGDRALWLPTTINEVIGFRIAVAPQAE